MKKARTVLTALLFFCLLMPFSSAFAEDAAPLSGEITDSTWDELVADFIESYDFSKKRIYLGYCNLVTGEEHYLEPDSYSRAASMYKLGIAMHYCDLIDTGELTWDSIINGYNLDYGIKSMIIHSNNDVAQKYWQHIGGWPDFRKDQAQYYGVDVEADEDYFNTNNSLTARQMITLLKCLYESRSTKYSVIFDCMLEAQPDKYFKYRPQEFEMGHKYGWLEYNGHQYINDCAIILTDEPIAIVMFTDNAGRRIGDAMADFCALMSDYAQAKTAYDNAQRQAEIKVEEQKEAEKEAFRKASEEKKAEKERQQQQEEFEASLIEEANSSPSSFFSGEWKMAIKFIALAVIAGAGIVFIIIRAYKRGK